MARPLKRYIEWFPHDARASRQSGTIEALESLIGTDGKPLGNSGYAFWFKLLEMLAGTPGMYLDCAQPDQWLRLTARTRLCDEDARACIEALVTMGNIDRQRWEDQRILWCPDLIARARKYLPRQGLDFGPPKPDCRLLIEDIRGASGRNVSTEDTAFGPVEIDHEWMRVEDSYAEQIGGLPMGKALDQLRELYEDMGADVVIVAIEYTNQKQPENPKRYLIQLLSNWQKAGVLSVSQARAQINDHEAKLRHAQPSQPAKKPAPSDGEAVRWVSY